MKIVLVSHDADYSGAPRIGFDIASSLARDHDVTLVSKREGPLIGLSKYSNLAANYIVTKTSHEYGSIPFNERVRLAVELLKDLNPALLYANSAGSCEWCVAARRLGIPSVLHTHEMAQGLKGLLAADVMKADITEHIDLLVSASEEATADLAAVVSTSVPRYLLFGIAIEADYVRAMADEGFARPTNRAGKELSRDKPVIAMCGTATARKGIDIFYETAKAIPEAEFLWIGPISGDPTSKRVMEAYRSERTSNFFVTGAAPNPYAYMQLCDVFALTSVEDPNPLVVAEALVLGKKVVSFHNTGGSWRWTRRFGYALSGSVCSQRLAAFLRKMVNAPSSGAWLESQYPKLYDAVDLDVRLPVLRRELSELVGAAV